MGHCLTLAPAFSEAAFRVCRLISRLTGSANCGRRGPRIGSGGGWVRRHAPRQRGILQNDGGLFLFITTARVHVRGRRSRMARGRSVILANRYVYCSLFQDGFFLRH